MQEFLCSVLAAAIEADRQAMLDAKMAENGYPQEYTDALMCFGDDWNVDPGLLWVLLVDSARVGVQHINEADPIEWVLDVERYDREVYSA